MERREFLTWCLSGCVSGGLLLDAERASGQQAEGRARLPGSGAGQSAEQPKLQRPPTGNIEYQVPKEVETLLLQWEQKSARVQRLSGMFSRVVYDNVFFVEKRAEGKFWYEAPDKGRMDFAPGRDLPTVNPEKKSPAGEPYTIQADAQQKWICNGKEVLIINDEQKLYDRVEIPPQQQGTNIINGPLPFLFGMKAAQAKDRYLLGLGQMHDPTGKATGTGRVHVVAAPKKEIDAREWRRAEVLMDPTYFLLSAIRLLDPTGNRETVYMFRDVKGNGVWLNNPFNDRPPPSYTLGLNSRAPAEEEAQEKPVVPAGGRKPGQK